MGEDRFPELPGFRLYDDFFAGLGDDFEPVALGAEDKQAYEREIASLIGYPPHEFYELRGDLGLTAKVREARRYDEDRLFVRFEFRRLEPQGTWSGPCQLMALFDAQRKLSAYTVLRDRDAVGEGLEYKITHHKYSWYDYETTKDPIAALTVLDTEDDPEVVICNARTKVPLVYVYGGMGPGKCSFDVEWYVGCNPWLLTLKDVGFDVIESVFDVVQEGGIRGLSRSFDWRLFDHEANWRKYGVRFDIDTELKRMLLQAQRDGDKMVEATVRAVGIGDDPIEDTYCIGVAPGSERRMMERVFDKTHEKDVAPEDVAKLLAYLAIRGEIKSLNNLGYLFHFGKGVKVDYDLAEFWHLRGADRGSASCMLSLGKVYSEKDGPKWDGPRAIEWFEKAVAHGDDWAKGELGHCLWCGECGGRDIGRAEKLLTEALKACPDREDFAETLDKIRNSDDLL